VAVIAYGLLHVGPEPTLSMEVDRPAIGLSTEVQSVAREERRGITRVTLTLEQGGRTVELDRFEAPSSAAWRFWESGPREVRLRAELAGGNPPWLEDGDVILRTTGWRRAGPLRDPQPVVVERRLPVRQRPPELRVLSNSQQVGPGRTGLVVFHPGPHAVESGVIAGRARFQSFAAPDGVDGERFVLFGVPLDVTEADQIRLYAVDDGGNRSERLLLDSLSARPPHADTILVTDAFLERVVPAIEAGTPGPDASASLLQRYLKINREMRAQNRSILAGLAQQSELAFLWKGTFVPLEDSVHTGQFADRRTYHYRDQEIDHQIHLGVDFASVANAPARAPNTGKVVFAGPLGIYGNAVVIDHGFGLISCSAHLSRISVETRQWVSRGQEIGRTGATGLAGGDHLHLEILVQGTAVDPMQWLDDRWVEEPLARSLSLILESTSLAAEANVDPRK
jgi:hypothetical protein